MSSDESVHGEHTHLVPRRSVLRASAATVVGSAATGITAGRDLPDEAHPGCPDRGGAESPPPGPPVLYEDPVTAPQFENGQGWEADPLLVSGSDAYVDGEYLYQDFVYDDYGANTTDSKRPPEPQPANSTYGAMTGDVVYPTDDATYRDNAADLLEFRCRLAENEAGIVYRITLNTMVDPAAAVVAVGIDTGRNETASDWGHGLGELGAAVDHVLVVAGDRAVLDGSDGTVQSVSVSEHRNQLEVTVDLAPGGETWTHYCVTGVHDGDLGFTPIQGQPDETTPGGAYVDSPPPVFNVGFRANSQEPMGGSNLQADGARDEIDDTIETGSRGVGFGHWRDHAQATALAARDVSQFHAAIDFGKLAGRETDRNVPDSGYLNRLYATRRPGKEGVDDGGAEADEDDGELHENRLTGHVQPYAVYVPDGYEDGEPAPLHLHLHSLTSTYNQYQTLMPDFLRQVGERLDKIVVTPEARGPGQWYHDVGEFAVFEAWADIRDKYDVDMDRVTLGGYSMGGYGTYKFASQWPDLFAKGFAIVGPPDEDILGGPTAGQVESQHNTIDIADNLRNVPLLMWNGTNDELVPLPGVLNYEQRLRDLEYRHELDVFPGYDHFTFGYRDQWGPGADFLADATVERRPQQVTYRRKPTMDDSDLGLVHDGAYWVSDVKVVSPDSDDGGLVDARSLAVGDAAPTAVDYRRPGTEPDPHVKRGTRWAEPAFDPPERNELVVDLDGVSAVTLWVEEAGIDPTVPLRLAVETTHDATITLAGSFGEREISVSPPRTERTVQLCPPQPSPSSGRE